MSELSLLLGDPYHISPSDPFIFTVGDYVKDNAYKRNPCILDEFKTNVSQITAKITPTTLQTVSSNLVRRALKRMQQAGGHFRRSDVAQ
jgi:hypothetical protein